MVTRFEKVRDKVSNYVWSFQEICCYSMRPTNKTFYITNLGVKTFSENFEKEKLSISMGASWVPFDLRSRNNEPVGCLNSCRPRELWDFFSSCTYCRCETPYNILRSFSVKILPEINMYWVFFRKLKMKSEGWWVLQTLFPDQFDAKRNNFKDCWKKKTFVLLVRNNFSEKCLSKRKCKNKIFEIYSQKTKDPIGPSLSSDSCFLFMKLIMGHYATFRGQNNQKLNLLNSVETMKNLKKMYLIKFHLLLVTEVELYFFDDVLSHLPKNNSTNFVPEVNVKIWTCFTSPNRILSLIKCHLQTTQTFYFWVSKRWRILWEPIWWYFLLRLEIWTI